VNASVSNLLRTTLSKTTKDQMISQQPLKIPTDTLKLEKHIKNLAERLEKGATLVPGAVRQTGEFIFVLICFGKRIKF